MIRYLGRRLLYSVFLLAAVSLLLFLFLDWAPGEFFSEMKLNPQISAETVAAWRAHYGLDQPFPVRYTRWLASVAHGDFGFSFAYNMPVASFLWQRAGNTLLLTSMAAALSWTIAVPLGILAAWRRGRWLDRMLNTATSTLLAIPELVLALALLMFAVRTRLLPVGGMVSTQFDHLSGWAKLHDLLLHLALPVSAIVLGTLPTLLRHVRASMAEVLDSSFTRAARGHGLPAPWILFRYGLRVAANPLIALFGFSIATLLSASLLVEVVMSWPGLGPMLLEAIFARDIYIVAAAVMLSTTFLVAGNFVADVLLYAADPRIRVEAL